MKQACSISIIIPVLDDDEALEQTLSRLTPLESGVELLVADGATASHTRNIAETFHGVKWLPAPQGRGPQMNEAVKEANGEVLLFLHADTELPSNWKQMVQDTMKTPRFSIGAFRFALRSPRWRYRLLEWGVRLRCLFFQLPYGDQALFVRRRDFMSIGGYLDQPIMEDVDLVRRLRKKGRLNMLCDTAISSPRNWERDGFFRRSRVNLLSLYRYFRGDDLRRISLFYQSARTAIVVFAKYPEPGNVKTRLAATEGDTFALNLYRKLVQETLHAVSQYSTATAIVYYSPGEREREVRGWLSKCSSFRPQVSGDLGDRMLAAQRDAHREGFARCIIIGTDCPELKSGHLEAADKSLVKNDLVLGPTGDGGYYLIGVRAPHPNLFRDINWSTEAVLSETLTRAEESGLKVALLEELHDLDDACDLAYHRQAGNISEMELINTQSEQS